MIMYQQEQKIVYFKAYLCLTYWNYSWVVLQKPSLYRHNYEYFETRS